MGEEWHWEKAIASQLSLPNEDRAQFYRQFAVNKAKDSALVEKSAKQIHFYLLKGKRMDVLI